MDPSDDTTTVRAQVPAAEMLNYEPQLRSKSGGRGSYTMEPSHNEELPGMLAEKVIAEVKKEKEAKA
jgi:elongation factor G